MSAAKPVVAASLVASTIVYIGYLWFKHRAGEDSNQQSSSPASHTERHLEQVQQRLTSIKRTRLETLEEEPVVSSENQSDNKDKTVTNREQDWTKTDQSEELTETLNSTEEIIVKEDIEANEPLENCIMAVEESPLAAVPDVFSALNDPLCGENESYSSSPVKSESAQSKSSCEWSDLIEQDMKDMQEFQLDSRELTCKLSGLELGSGRSNDSGVASPSEEDQQETPGLEKERGEITKSRTQSGEDAGIGSEQGDEITADVPSDDNQLLAYHFYIPEGLCGKLIGEKGRSITELKNSHRVNIWLKELASDIEEKKKKKLKNKKDYRKKPCFEDTEMKLCGIEGTRANIDKCLDKLKEKFATNSEINFEQVNGTRGYNQVNLNNGSVNLALAEGVMHDVFVSSIVGGGHVFLQQPYHPTYFALERLDQCMSKTYSQVNCPHIPEPVVLNSVCAAPCDEGWYRCQIVSYDKDTEMCDIKYLDYGGYHSISVHSLRQIRTDFLSLPFQAIECYLANINPTDDENISAFVLEELVSAQVVQARMIGTNEQGVPMIHLYRSSNGQTTMVNRELVDRECAQWLDTTIVKLECPLDHPSVMWSTLGNFQNRNLGPNPWDQLNPIYFLPTQNSQQYLESENLSFEEADLSFEQPCEVDSGMCNSCSPTSC